MLILRLQKWLTQTRSTVAITNFKVLVFSITLETFFYYIDYNNYDFVIFLRIYYEYKHS